MTREKRTKKISRGLVAVALLAVTLSTAPVSGQVVGRPGETAAQRDARMKWWREAKFGLFIHWGVYAVPAGTYKGKQIPGIGEWIMNRGKIPVAEYKPYAKQFNPVKYDPDAWVRLAKEAGMKYLVITSKHHDGFALFDSKATDWDVVDATPYGKDLLKPLAEACRKHGIVLGFYYSQAQDWNHPGGSASGGHWDPAQDGDMDKYIREIAAPQVREILSNYGKLGVLWWDTPVGMTKERADMLLPLLELQPDIITNNRLGGGYAGDLSTPEQRIPATGMPGRDWETCMTMNGTWGFKSYDHNWKSTETLIRNLVDIVSKGGNYLLNVGPTAEGEIPQPSIDRLKAIGKWMDANGESIYATTASPFPKLGWGRCTKKVRGDRVTLYLHVFDWPKDGKLLVTGLRNPIRRAQLLATGAALETRVVPEGVVIDVPAEPLDPIDTIIVARVRGELDVEKVLPRQAADGTMTLETDQANLHADGGRYAQVESIDGKSSIGYWLNDRAWVSWEFTIDKPGTFEITTQIATPAAGSKFEIAVGDEKLIAEAPNTGDYRRFKAVTLGQIRIAEKGECHLTIKPVRGQWTAINLRDLVLKPTN